MTTTDSTLQHLATRLTDAMEANRERGDDTTAAAEIAALELVGELDSDAVITAAIEEDYDLFKGAMKDASDIVERDTWELVDALSVNTLIAYNVLTRLHVREVNRTLEGPGFPM